MLKWSVKNYDCSANIIEDYDILRYREEDIKKMKKKSSTIAEFANKLKTELMCRYWSRAEYELIIKKTEDGRIILSPWCGCRNPEEVAVDVTDDTTFDWKGFADEHISKQVFKNEAKIDIYDQLMYGDRFKKLVNSLWTTRFKYERDNPKFHERDGE